MSREQIASFSGVVTDSKQMTERQREAMFALCLECPHHLAQRDAAFINQHGIQRPTPTYSSRQSGDACAKHAGRHRRTLSLDLPCDSVTLTKAESTSITVAIASVLAKVMRDRRMAELHKIHPHYDWEKNKGYGTPRHAEA